jgi:hypothetical protein
MSKPEIKLSVKLYENINGEFVADYIVPVKGVTGAMDLAIEHKCFVDGVLFQLGTSRLYWSGKGKDKEGHWNLDVPADSECTGVVIDLDNNRIEVSDPISYLVE